VRRRDAERIQLRDAMTDALRSYDRTVRITPEGVWLIWNENGPRVGRFELCKIRTKETRE
jgi:hypothetical protein